MKKVKKGKHRAPKSKRRVKPKPRIKERMLSIHPPELSEKHSLPNQFGINDTFETPSQLLAKASAALDRSDPHLAFDICREVLAIDSFDAGALNLAGVAAFQVGLIEEALELLEAAVFQSPGHAEAQTNLGNVLAHLGRQGDAAVAYEQAMQVDPNNSEAFFNFGLLMETEGQPTKAVTAFEKTLETNPSHALAWHGLGNALKTLEQLEAAKSAFEAALKQDPELATARTNLAAVLHELGNFKGAAKQSKRALKLSPDLVEARYNLGTALQELGRHEEAIEAYEQVILYQPKHAVIFPPNPALMFPKCSNTFFFWGVII